MKSEKPKIRNSTAEFLTFTYQTGADGVDVHVQDSTVWLSQKAIGKLFDTTTDNISLHIKNIFNSGELEAGSVVEDFSVTATDGKNYQVKHYNLDTIIAVGYRVNSTRATDFRKWATTILRNFTLRGYVLDKKRMENGVFLGEDYFEQLLEEIREIRMSERRFYQKVTDIYATAMDYDKSSPITREFFAKVQNKLHFAVHGQTAAEVIFSRADAELTHMGLTTWALYPIGKILKSDVIVAKNYLSETELRDLGLLVNAYLDLAERRARQKQPMSMHDWAQHLDLILQADGNELLKNAGKISAEVAKLHAEGEYEKYRIVQDRLWSSDFDRETEALLQKNLAELGTLIEIGEDTKI